MSDYCARKKGSKPRVFAPCLPRRKPHEEWKEIKGYKGYYVSNYGRVANGNFFPYSCNEKRGLLKIHINRKTGRATVCLQKDGKQYKRLVSRLVAEAFIPNPENKSYVHHIDGNPQNNRAKNLRWVTYEEHLALHRCMREARKHK